MAQSLSHPEERTAHPAPSHDPNHFVPGSMDISEQERTFEGFMRWTVRAGIAVVVVLVFMALVNA